MGIRRIFYNLYIHSRSTTQWPVCASGIEVRGCTSQRRFASAMPSSTAFPHSRRSQHRSLSLQVKISNPSMKSKKNVGKFLPHPVGVFYTLLEPPTCYVLQTTHGYCLLSSCSVSLFCSFPGGVQVYYISPPNSNLANLVICVCFIKQHLHFVT